MYMYMYACNYTLHVPDVSVFILPQGMSQSTSSSDSGSSESDSSSDESVQFDDGLDDELVGDEEDRRKLADMTEAEREQEMYLR